MADWFVRRSRDSALIGPLKFSEADNEARFISLEDGYAEVVTYLGSRGGDPLVDTPRLFVDGLYVAGRKFLGGRAAQYHSDRRLIEDFLG